MDATHRLVELRFEETQSTGLCGDITCIIHRYSPPGLSSKSILGRVLDLSWESVLQFRSI